MAQHAELAHAKSVMQGLGILADGIGLAVEYTLRYSGAVKKGTARAIHTAINDMLMIGGGTGALAKTVQVVGKASGKTLRGAGKNRTGKPQSLGSDVASSSNDRGLLPEPVEVNLLQSQQSNFKRFLAKIPTNSENIQIKSLPNGGRAFIADSPSINIPGSFARYEKQVDKNGNTLQYMKTTFGPTGEIIHIAPKHPIGSKIHLGE